MKHMPARVASANHTGPERHALHVTEYIPKGGGKFLALAFSLYQGHHQGNGQPDAFALGPDRLQNPFANLSLGVFLGCQSLLPPGQCRCLSRLAMSRNPGTGGVRLTTVDLGAVRKH